MFSQNMRPSHDGIVSQSVDACSVTLPSESLVWFASPEGGLINIEQVGANSSANSCHSPRRPFAMMTHENDRRAVFYRPRCKQWSCGCCAAVNGQIARFEAVYGANTLIAGGATMDFVTLTSHERLSPEQSVTVYPSAWGKLRRRVVRRADVEYFAVPEQHRDGRLHMHMMFAYQDAKQRLARKWWKDTARACGMGYQVAVEPMTEGSKVGVYVTKYMHKSLEGSLWPKGFRRFRTSNGWPQPSAVDLAALGWKASVLPQYRALQTAADQLVKQGYTVVLCDERQLSQILPLGA